VRCLGIETSSRRGSVALVEHDRVVALRFHEELNRHGERILPLAEQLLAEASWPTSSLDRLGVGIGPGSFTGLRIGIALANGIALGIDRPLVGVGSLHSMARAAAPADGPIAAVLDARRSEFFIALFDANGKELVAPQAIAQQGAEAKLRELAGASPARIVGEAANGWTNSFKGNHADLPSARVTALLAGELDPAQSPAIPLYIRGANAIKPNLPPSPLRAD
jgi:tRNA threonylcarbamoyladenosine biosynthesis protein TsaB